MDTCDKMDFHRTWYEYDVLGNLTEVTDAANNVTTMNYDALGRKVNMTDPDMGYWTYGYDNAGNLISQTDLKGQDIRFFYDAINRLTEKRLIVEEQQSGLLLASYSYDNTVDFNKGIGRRTGMVAYDPPGVVNNSASWKYDSLGRVIQENRVVASNTYRFDFGYTQGDLPVTVRYPGGTAGQQGEIVTTNYYWITGQPKTLVGTSTYVYDAQYNMPTGQTTQLNLAGPAIYTNYNYDANFRLQSLATIANGNTQLSYRYTYDPVGNVTEIKDLTPPNGVGKTAPSQIQAFKYDSLNRLVHAQATGDGSGLYNETYAYDAIGNLINKAGQVMGYGTGTAGPHAVTTVNGVQQYWYDDNGNMTQRPDGNGGTHELYWTAENMLSTVGGDSETAASFRYDADGMMVLRTEGADNGVSTVYLGKLYQHKLSVSNVVTKHYMFNGQLVAQREGASSVTFLLGDHLGSVTTVLWASGAVKDNQRYNPWGEVRWAQSGNPITGYSYTSQRYDDALGLYDYNARYYDPTIGRFISADTIVPSMSNADSRLTPLTVSFSEPVMIEQQNVENRQLLWFGPSFTWSQRLVQIFELVVPLGPIAPQTLNRYAYTLNNPIQYTDPTGHETFYLPGIGTVIWEQATDIGPGWWRFQFDSEVSGMPSSSFVIHDSHPDFKNLQNLIALLKENVEDYVREVTNFESALEGFNIAGVVTILSLIVAILGLILPGAFALAVIGAGVAILGAIVWAVFGFLAFVAIRNNIKDAIEDGLDVVWGNKEELIDPGLYVTTSVILGSCNNPATCRIE